MSEWRADPVGRHQERLHDGARWTDQVRDRGIVNTDASGLDAVQPPAPPPLAVPMVPTVPAPAPVPGAPAPVFGRVGNPSAPGLAASPMVPAISSSAAPTGHHDGSYRPGTAPPGQSAALSSMGNNSIITGLIAGGIGGGIGAVIAEVLKSPDKMTADSETALRLNTGIWVMLAGATIGLVLAAWPALTAKAWGKAARDGAFGAVAGGIAGFIGGFAAQWLYSAMLEDMDYTSSQSDMENRIRLSRMLAWGLFGAATGLGLGIRDGAKKAFNGLLGGAIGGAIGGLIFQQIAFSGDETSGFQVRLIGLVATGVGIGLGIGIVDRLRREAWLKLTTGPLRGREVILYKETTTIGGDSRCDLVLANDPSVSGQHASFRRSGGAATTVTPMGPVTVNGTEISAPVGVKDGDVVQVGSTSITYEER
ncbi:MAG: ubiquitin--protein ligase [Ilumatobacteraceae bacterium]|nr:ubiquitin--protein ligase [Ilumatobacteraceae bacterium]